MGLLNPIALLLSALYAVLILLYLRERTRRNIDVPSLLLWAAVPEERLPRGRPRVDPLFALQLLLMTLLIAGLTGPYWKGWDQAPDPIRHIFILDVSASMQAREADGTRFDKARVELGKRLDRLPPQDEAMLIAAANHPRVIVPFSADRARLRDTLDALSPLDTGTSLDLALAVARSIAHGNDLPVRTEVFTDLPPSRLDPTLAADVGLAQFGATDENLAISSLQVHQGRFEDHRKAGAQVVVHNFSHREAHGLLRLELGDEIVSHRGFSLGPRTARAFSVRGFSRPGLVRATLDVNDSLAVDNHAYGWVRPVRPLRVLVISESAVLRATLEGIGSAAANLDFRFGWPGSNLDAVTGDAEVMLLDRYVPDEDPKLPTLYVHPPAESRRFAAGGGWSELEVLDWSTTHPATRGLHLALPQPLRNVERVDAPAWAETLLTARSGSEEVSLAFAGEHDGRRTACLAFDLAEQQLLSADRVELLLFFLGLIEWLAPREDDVALAATGDVHVLADLGDHPRRVVDPRGQTQVHPAEGPLPLETLFAGEYLITADGTRRRVVANLFDPAESDIGRAAGGATWSPKPLAAGGKPFQATSLTAWLYWAAAALFLLEWMIWARGR